MGRTVAPFSQIIDKVIARFENYRRALRREDREIFDELMRTAKRQVQAGVMAQNPNAFDSMSMSMLLEMKKEILQLQKEITELKAHAGPAKAL